MLKVHNANGTESVVLNNGFVDERMNVYFRGVDSK